MRQMRLAKCIKLLDLMYSGGRSDEKAQAKALAASLRSVSSYRQAIRDARKVRPPLPVGDGQDEGSRGRVSPIDDSPRRSRAHARKSNPSPFGRGRERAKSGSGTGDHHHYLSRLVHCDYLLALEYSGWRGDVHELARTLGVSERTILREMHLIEDVLGRPLRLVKRRKKRPI